MSTYANSYQIGGAHYRTSMQHWDLVAEAGLGYFDGQVTKYVSRWRLKNGTQDIQKAKHFAEKYHELLRGGILRPVTSRNDKTVGELLSCYAVSADLTKQEEEIVSLLINNHGPKEVFLVVTLLEELLLSEPGKSYVDQD